MYPLLVDWGPVVIPAWHTFFVLGALAAFFLLHNLNHKSKNKVDPVCLSRVYACAYIGGYFGARALNIVVEGEASTAKEFFLQLTSFGGMVFYGGFLGGFAAAATYARVKRLPARYLIDIGILPVLLGLSLGRVGCFLNGDDFGKPVTNQADSPWWAVTLPNLNDGIARFPVQIMEAVAAATIVIAGTWFLKKGKPSLREGSVGLGACFVYGFTRFGLESFRGDERGWVIAKFLSTSQFISFLLVITSGVALHFLMRQGEGATTQQ